MRLLLLLLLATACCCCLTKRVAQPWPLKGGVKPRQGKPSSVIEVLSHLLGAKGEQHVLASNGSSKQQHQASE